MIDHMVDQATRKAHEILPRLQEFRMVTEVAGDLAAAGFHRYGPGGADDEYVSQGWVFFYANQETQRARVWHAWTNDTAGWHTWVTIRD